jgi:PncC family amidohydrolase
LIQTLEAMVGEQLRQHNLTLATAESCTGGLIADRITNIPGSSEYFRGGIVAYAYEAKVALLDVSWDTLRTYGAVSRETVIEMARGVRIALGADLAVSVSGIAGPGGGLAR